MKRKTLSYIAKKIAKFYWAYLKKEIDDFVINFQKKDFKLCGSKVIFKAGGTIYHPENLSIEDHVQIGDNCFIMAIGGVNIGEGTIISRNVCIHSGNHDYKSNKSIPYDNKYILREVNIGKAVWIGQNVNILPGVTIGDGAIIGMGTTVSKSVGKGEIVVGNGQRTLGSRDQVSFNELLEAKSFFGEKFSNL